MKNGVSSPDTVNDTNVLKDEEDGDKLSSYKLLNLKHQELLSLASQSSNDGNSKKQVHSKMSYLYVRALNSA